MLFPAGIVRGDDPDLEELGVVEEIIDVPPEALFPPCVAGETLGEAPPGTAGVCEYPAGKQKLPSAPTRKCLGFSM